MPIIRPTPENLQNQDYILLEKVEHSEFNAFLQKQTWKSSKFQFLYYLIVLLFGVMTLRAIWQSSYPVFQSILFACIGVLLALIIVPIHESLHFFIYKYFGASNVKIKSYLSRGYVLTKADKFVVSKYEMKWIAPAPFLIISAIGFILLFFLSDLWQISACSMILFHSTLCSSDFRILDYFLSSDQDIYMYDDLQEQATYIYKR